MSAEDEVERILGGPIEIPIEGATAEKKAKEKKPKKDKKPKKEKAEKKPKKDNAEPKRKGKDSPLHQHTLFKVLEYALKRWNMRYTVLP